MKLTGFGSFRCTIQSRPLISIPTWGYSRQRGAQGFFRPHSRPVTRLYKPACFVLVSIPTLIPVAMDSRRFRTQASKFETTFHHYHSLYQPMSSADQGNHDMSDERHCRGDLAHPLPAVSASQPTRFTLRFPQD